MGGLITFDSVAASQKAKAKNGLKCQGRPIIITDFDEDSIPNPYNNPPSTRIGLMNFPTGFFTEKKIKEFFDDCGEISNIYVHEEKNAFISVSSLEFAKKAISKH